MCVVTRDPPIAFLISTPKFIDRISMLQVNNVFFFWVCKSKEESDGKLDIRNGNK